MDAEWLLHRFQRQVEQAAKKVVEKWPHLIDVSLDDARQQAALALLEHQRSGQLDRDAAKAASPSQLDCFVLAALNGDLHTWAKKIHTDIKRGIEWGVTQALDQEDGFDRKHSGPGYRLIAVGDGAWVQFRRRRGWVVSSSCLRVHRRSR
jgi:hypothetical protein